MQYRHQFDRPLAEFGQVQEKLARMDAYVYAMDAMLYLTTAFLDRHDEDIMLETAMCKVFCSEMGYRTVNDCLQIMGGESYMTENHVERICATAGSTRSSRRTRSCCSSSSATARSSSANGCSA